MKKTQFFVKDNFKRTDGIFLVFVDMNENGIVVNRERSNNKLISKTKSFKFL